MADVKWSNDSEFVPQTSIGSTDEIMGLTSGNVNAKYPRSLFITNSDIKSTTNILVEGVGAAPNINVATSNQDITAIGTNAAAAIPNTPTNPSRSLFIGNNSGSSYTTSGSANDQHTGVGYFSLRNLTTGQFNTAFGSTSGFTVTNGSYNTLIGSGANVSIGNSQNRTVLGFGAVGDTDNQVVLGDSDVTSIVSNGNASLGTPTNQFTKPYFKSTQGAITITAYTLAITDSWMTMVCDNLSNQIITVPLHSTAPIAVGTQINFFQAGQNKITFATESGVTAILSFLNNLSLAGRYSGCTLTKIATDTWALVGNLAV